MVKSRGKDAAIPKQVEPAINPNLPTTDERHAYYILQEPSSPSVAPPNAIRVVQYKRRQFLHDDPEDFRRPYGFAEWENELTFSEIYAYNLLPFDRDLIFLYDLWVEFGKDKKKLLNFFTQFSKIITGDPKRRRLDLAIKLVMGKLSLKKIMEMVKKIE